MNKTAIKEQLDSILRCLNEIGQPVSAGVLESHLRIDIHAKTLQRRLKKLVDSGLVIAAGGKKSRTYQSASFSADDHVTEHEAVSASANPKGVTHVIFSDKSLAKLAYLDTPTYGRVKSTYQVALLEKYVPNKTWYVPLAVRKKLYKMGKRFNQVLAAGTYAKQIGQRLLIDLSYNSSRLEGNTYSKLDTQKLIEHGLSAEGKIQEETVMIMNHKEAIAFLVENADELSLTPFTIRNVHYLLSQDLVTNPKACGRERETEVTIGKSAYKPLAQPHQLREYLAMLLLKAEQINDSFEQSFFLLMHLSYLQAFEDVNKRTARLSCNIPFIRQNLCPMSFVDVPQEDYFKALLYFYETNELLPALELFEWAYKKSCEQYEVVKESLGEIDAYRIQHRAARKEAMGQIIRNNIIDKKLHEFLSDYCGENNIEQPEKFIAMTITDLMHLHEGAIIGLGVTEAMFKNWHTSK